MRPISLRMQAFGPFAEAQEVDFARVASGGLFLIHGQTGAGKTSLLDGICFALFGSSSGKERDGAGMRSDYANLALATEVEFVFELGPERFRARRRPAQRLKKKRGEGTKLDRPEAQLDRWTATASAPTASALPEAGWRAMAAGADDVTSGVEALLGMGERQFRQVVILPQGQFRQFLAASSQEREQILETLFRTGEFRALAETLRARFLALETGMKGGLLALKGRLAGLGMDDRALLPARIEALREAALASASARDEALARQRAARMAADAWAFANAALTERRRAEEQLAVLARGEAEARDWAELRARSERAQPLQATLAARVRDESDLAEIERRRLLEKAKAEGARARAALTASEQARAIAEEARCGDLERAMGEIDARLALAQRLAPARSARESARERALLAATALRRLESAAMAAAADHAAGAGLAQALELEAIRAPGLAAEVNALRASLRAVLGLQRAEREIAEAEADAARATEASAAAQREARQRELDLAGVRGRHSAAQAAMLAQALAPGAPCPVCGSIEHPRLAPSAPADASHEAVEACERAARGAAEAASKAYAAEAQAASRAKSARAQARDLREGLSLELLDPKEPSSAARERLSAAGLAKAEESKACESAAARLIEAQRAREAAKARAERALSAEQAARGEAVAAAAAASEASARVDALEAGNEAQSLDPILLAAERARGMGEMARLRARATACRIEAEEAARALALAEGVAAELAARAADLAARLAATEQRLGAMAAAAGFADASEAAQALLSAERQGEIEMRLLARAQAVAAAEDARARALAACASLGADTLNGAAIESELALADAAARAALEASAAAHEAERRFVEQARAIEVAYDRLLRDEAAFAALGRLAKVAQGLPPENATGVSLQRFVLGSQLDLVLERATHRLQRMTRGQFSLRRVRNRDDARRSAGLDIEVEDAYTGTARPASYLSGGESFMAALSLALGLADVAQEASGGSRLDAVFVDEGFGTLDSEALDQALRALADLSGADKRLVGVISHLPELREQIERRLLVSRGIRGSSIAWQ